MPDPRGANVCGEFQTLLRGFVDVDKIGQRLAEGLDATESKFSQHEGIFTDERQLVNWSERREYILAAAKLTGYYVDKQGIEVPQDVSLTDAGRSLKELLDRVSTRIRRSDDAGGTSRVPKIN